MKCENCGKHEGTQKWLGNEGMMAFTHGMWRLWCECCCLKEQIKFAKERTAAIPKMEKELLKLKCK